MTAPALIVSHGQPSDPVPAEAALRRLAREVAAHLPDRHVASATLASPGALEAAMEKMDAAPLVYPLFMTDGWFVRSALPKRLGGRDHRLLPPLGVDPRLPDLTAGVLRVRLAEAQWDAAETDLLVAAHGSGRSDSPKRDTEAFIDALCAHIGFARVWAGYVEQAPFLAEAAAQASTRALCLPFFAAEGGHVQDDVPQALAEGGFAAPCLPPLGTFPGIPALIAAALREAATPG